LYEGSAPARGRTSPHPYPSNSEQLRKHSSKDCLLTLDTCLVAVQSAHHQKKLEDPM
jgi:hypothetical protein